MYAELDYEDGEGLKKFYDEEHFPRLDDVEGYRRGVRYKAGPESPTTNLSKQARFLALHDWDEKTGMHNTPEMDKVSNTPWTNQVMNDVKFVRIRIFELIKAVGY
jgi:hypothetical protein